MAAFATLGVAGACLFGSAAWCAQHGPKSGSCWVAHEYVKRINAERYDQVGSLFADDAIYYGPDGVTRHGARDIGANYVKMDSVYRPRMRGISFIQDGSDCVMELEVLDKASGKYKLMAVDHFTVNAQGKISQFRVYFPPGMKMP